MASSKYHLINGDIQSERYLAEQSIRWIRDEGASLRFTWKASGTRIPFYAKQYKLLVDRLNMLGDNTNPIPSEAIFKSQLVKLIQKNRLFKGLEIHIIIKLFSKEEDKTNPGYLVFTDHHPDESFIMNQQGLLLGISDTEHHPGGKIMPFIELHHPLRLKWRAEAIRHNYDTICLLNNDGKLVETSDSTLFLARKSKLYTPDLRTGVTPRAIREEIINIIDQFDFKLVETDALEPGHLKQADEVFIADDQHGIRWVMGFENKRFYRKLSQIILAKINADWDKIT